MAVPRMPGVLIRHMNPERQRTDQSNIHKRPKLERPVEPRDGASRWSQHGLYKHVSLKKKVQPATKKEEEEEEEERDTRYEEKRIRLIPSILC